jgi:hypothetical protein
MPSQFSMLIDEIYADDRARQRGTMGSASTGDRDPVDFRGRAAAILELAVLEKS